LQLTSGGDIRSTSTQINDWREWTFDPIGNRTAKKRGSGSLLTWGSNQLNQVISTPSGGVNLGSPTYDYSGNMLTQTGWTYTYDGNEARQPGNGVANRSAAAPSLARGEPDRAPLGRAGEQHRLRPAYKTSTQETYRYSYDYLGRRVRKER
jgi:hypothetical protein